VGNAAVGIEQMVEMIVVDNHRARGAEQFDAIGPPSVG
jgi:hypothetical protein